MIKNKFPFSKKNNQNIILYFKKMANIKKEFIANEIYMLEKISDGSMIIRKLFFDEETFRLKRGIPYDAELLRCCLNAPKLSLCIGSLKEMSFPENASCSELLEMFQMVQSGKVNNSTEKYVEFMTFINTLKHQINDMIENLGKKSYMFENLGKKSYMDENYNFLEKVLAELEHKF